MRKAFFMAAVLAVFALPCAWGQANSAGFIDLIATLADSFHSQISALGDRLRSRDKASTVFHGRFIQGQSPSRPARVTLQVPEGFTRLEGFLPGNTPLVFDGDSHARRPKMDANFLETFAMDTVEGLIASLRNGAAARLVAQDSAGTRGVGNKDEPRYVIFEVTDLVRTDGGGSYRQKFFYFDTRTGLLARTLYQDEGTAVEVRFSHWQRVDGSAYPGQIDRLEDHQLQFSFVVSEVSAGPQKGAASFRQELP
jgi:hypothetical protein